jgi:hypothetical protein
VVATAGCSWIRYASSSVSWFSSLLEPRRAIEKTFLAYSTRGSLASFRNPRPCSSRVGVLAVGELCPHVQLRFLQRSAT